MNRARSGASATAMAHQDWKKAYVRLAAGQSIDYEAQAQSQAKR